MAAADLEIAAELQFIFKTFSEESANAKVVPAIRNRTFGELCTCFQDYTEEQQLSEPTLEIVSADCWNWQLHSRSSWFSLWLRDEFW